LDLAHYRDLFDEAPCGYVVMNVDGTIVEANRAFLRLVNIEKALATGLRFRTLLTSAGAIFYDTQVLPTLLLNGTRNEIALDLRVQAGRVPVLVNFALKHRDPAQPLIRAIVFQAKERREFEKELLRMRRDAEQLAEVISHSTDAIITLRDDGTVRNWNQGAAEMFGYQSADAVGRSISNIVSFDNQFGSLETAMGALKLGKELSGESIGIRKDLTRVEISVKLTPHMEAPGVLVAFSAVLRDISTQKQAERAVLQSEKLASVGRLASSIAHEINNPLEAVTNLLYILAHQVTEPNAKELIQSAQDELARVAQIATHTLRFHRQSSNPSDLNLANLFESVIALYRARLRNSDITATIGRSNAKTLFCHEGELRQIILNIVGNAVDAMKHGGTLSLRCREATLWSTGQQGVRMTIGDNGIGMEAATQSRIFEPFFSTKGIGGTGLGLWVTQDLVLKNRGSMRVRSAKTATAHGTVFSLFFPHASN
jgi:PAS domain S-box-containing protein